MLKIKKVTDEILKTEKNQEYAKAVVSYLSLILDKMIDINTTISRWESIAQCPRGIFARQTISSVWDYAESVPISSSSGSFEVCMKNTMAGLLSIGDIENSANVYQGTATRLPSKDKFFDAIVTDPPYYDAVPYSDISDFFYIWLKRIIGEFYPNQFTTLLTPKSSEIIQTVTRHEGNKEKAKKWYEEQMTLAFKESNRTLKNDGIFVIVFAHKTTSAWETLVSSLLNSDLVVTSSWPLKTENISRMRAHESAALASSIFIVCRKRITEEEGYFNDIKEDLEKRVHEKLDEFWRQGIRGADFFISSIGPAVEVFGKYKKVRKLSGEEVTVAEFLDLVRQIVTDYSLRKILRKGSLGDIDEITRFYVLWRWAYNHNDIIFDDARKLAQALGTEADQLIHKIDILQKKGDKVRLLGPKEREEDKDLGEPKGGVPAPMIDVLHRACLLWEKGNRKKLAEFIEESGYKDNETIWSVAQNLSLVLPDGDKEKQLLQGFLASKSVAISDRFKPQKTLKLYMGGEE